MNEPAAYIAYQPLGHGLVCAVMVLVDGSDVYGWYAGPLRGQYVSAFFMLEHYYSIHETAFYHSVGDDVYDDWVLAYPPKDIGLGPRSPLPQGVGHELERAQAAFVAEWLVFSEDEAHAADVEWYRARSLPLEHVGIRCDKLPKFTETPLEWTYASPALDLNIIECLRKRWPLDFALAA
ncbi:hypothetical protein AB1286_20340 [Trinickia sp. NRRL B-1857]|uniref:hypothetical protein n=1 Tax=Trinickia sp. NRRL B-1857 TaxID=3162879 RepID=UPI003D2CCA8A